ncbi:conjugal transfer protein TrbL family protein [Brevibacillus agri]|uniref:conjugal transfer protein TrbL family protein n=1 Tax=Brevibacillus agri TaxID=51101 RepID=UPI0018CF3E80|nr:conjugal transfer protein TrbL family protein [Brevibacillus agri]MBG9568421.1 hypothetical protein [Brevibacillus agri]
MNYPTTFWGWVSFLTLPRMPQSLSFLFWKLVTVLPIHRHRKLFFFITLGMILIFPAVAFAEFDFWKKITSFSIWGWISDLASDLAQEAYKGLTAAMFSPTDLSNYPNIQDAINMSRAVAGGLLTVAVAFEALQSVGLRATGEGRSLSELARGTFLGAVLIFFLPWSVEHLFLPVNNYLLEAISNLGVGISAFQGLLLFSVAANPEGTILMFMVYSIFCLILAVVSGIRYVELVVCIVLSPIVAVSAARGGEAIGVWVRETTAIVFTQCVHLLMINLLFNFVGAADFWGFLKATGVIFVMLRGPQVLRQFLYSSGTGNALVNAAGSGGRLVAMKMMTKVKVV